MPLRAGELNRRIELQRRVVSNDAAGGPSEAWETFATVWAKVTPRTGRQLETADQRALEADTVALIRYRTDILREDRVRYSGETYEIAWSDLFGFNEGLQLSLRRLSPQPLEPTALADFDETGLADFDDVALADWGNETVASAEAAIPSTALADFDDEHLADFDDELLLAR